MGTRMDHLSRLGIDYGLIYRFICDSYRDLVAYGDPWPPSEPTRETRLWVAYLCLKQVRGCKTHCTARLLGIALSSFGQEVCCYEV
jgi:hypothetical protein